MWAGSFIWNRMGITKYIQWFFVLSRRDLEITMATSPYWRELVMCSILWYIRMPNRSRLWHHVMPYFAHLVHRQSLAPATITRLFFLVMKALSLSLQTSPNHEFCTLHLVSGILAVPWSPTSVGIVRTASWRHSAGLPRVLEYLFM